MKFPYVQYEEMGVPVIPIEIKGDKWHEIWGFVDSGATYTTLHSEEGDRLGVNPFSGERIMVTVGDGGSIPIYLHELMVKVGTMNLKPS
jgi:predicted aspartyl protease